jgi:CRISPR/Cas system CSM-associated protein Csm3 (group 7 of RAMP superfamily)
MGPVHPFRIDLFSQLCIGTGMPSLEADQTVVRDGEGRPMIPATTLKGAARDLVRVHGGLPADILAAAFGTAGRSSAGRGGQSGRSDGSPSAVIITDARCRPGSAPTVSIVRTVALDDDRVAVPGALASFEVVEPWVDAAGGSFSVACFQGTVRPSPLVGVEQGEQAVGAVLAGLSAIASLGSRTSRGWGRVRVAIDDSGARLARAVMLGAAA